MSLLNVGRGFISQIQTSFVDLTAKEILLAVQLRDLQFAKKCLGMSPQCCNQSYVYAASFKARWRGFNLKCVQTVDLLRQLSGFGTLGLWWRLPFCEMIQSHFLDQVKSEICMWIFLCSRKETALATKIQWDFWMAQRKPSYLYGKTTSTFIASGIHVARSKDWEHTHTYTHISQPAGIARHVRTESAVAPFPPRPVFRFGLCMSNPTKLAIAVQHTTETSTQPLRMLEIAQVALKERVKKNKLQL